MCLCVLLKSTYCELVMYALGLYTRVREYLGLITPPQQRLKL